MTSHQKSAPADGHVTLENWREPPRNRWAFHHVSQIVPCAMIWSGQQKGETWPLDLQDVSKVRFDWRGEPTTVADMLEQTYTDGFIILHRGRCIHQSYDAGMQPHIPHILFSITKSVVGLMAGILAARGDLDLDHTIGDYLPEMRRSGYADASIQQVLDMTVGIGFQEDYEAPTGDMVRYREASGWSASDPRDAIGMHRFLATLPPAGPHGEVFKYCSPNTDLMGWVFERVTGQAFADLMSETLWSPMGAEDNAYIGVDGYGTPRTSGGLCVTTRDLARLGQFVLEGGSIGGRALIPEAWIADIIEGGDPATWKGGSFSNDLPDARYRSGWYKYGQDALAIGGWGIYGQSLYIHRPSETVFAKHSSQPKPMDFQLDVMQRAAFEALAKELG